MPISSKKTVAEYNGYCDVRHDAEFAKDPKYLREVKTGPFYAIKSVASSLGTLGGIKANERFEVVTPEEDPIPGLYAAGNDVGGMYGDSYDLLMAGSTVGFAVNSGRIAVDSAAEYIRTLEVTSFQSDRSHSIFIRLSSNGFLVSSPRSRLPFKAGSGHFGTGFSIQSSTAAKSWSEKAVFARLGEQDLLSSRRTSVGQRSRG